jgi:hypothetical protein
MLMKAATIFSLIFETPIRIIKARRKLAQQKWNQSEAGQAAKKA